MIPIPITTSNNMHIRKCSKLISFAQWNEASVFKNYIPHFLCLEKNVHTLASHCFVRLKQTICAFLFFLLTDSQKVILKSPWCFGVALFCPHTGCVTSSKSFIYHNRFRLNLNHPSASVQAPVVVWLPSLHHLLMAFKGILLSHEEGAGGGLSLFRLKMRSGKQKVRFRCLVYSTHLCAVMSRWKRRRNGVSKPAHLPPPSATYTATDTAAGLSHRSRTPSVLSLPPGPPSPVPCPPRRSLLLPCQSQSAAGCK